jgi:hypothetical protein
MQLPTSSKEALSISHQHQPKKRTVGHTGIACQVNLIRGQQQEPLWFNLKRLK